MKLSKGKIILLLVVIYFSVFALININKEKNINNDILDNVTYISDGKLDPKNDGKLVLVTGKISYDNLESFIELDENFGAIKINRKVEDYIKYYDNNKNEYKYKWLERKELVDNTEEDYLKTITSSEKISNITVGEYVLDDVGKEKLPTKSYYDKEESIGGLTTIGRFYTRDPWEENLEEGDIKLTYKYYDVEKNPYISILAVQKDNSLIPYKVDNKKEVYQIFIGKVDTKDKLTKELNVNVKHRVKGKTSFIVLIIIIGIFLIVDNKKTNKKDA